MDVTTPIDGQDPMPTPDLAVLEEIQRRVLWLAVRMVDSANTEREPAEIEVGGPQQDHAVGGEWASGVTGARTAG